MQQLNADEAQRGIDITLHDRDASTIFAYLYQQVSSQQDAEDLLLEVFMAAHNSETFFGITTKRQLAWLRRVARNKVIDHYRHTALLTILPLEHALETEDDELTPEQRVVQRENYERLSPLQQQLIRLRYGNGLRLVEIAR